MELNYDAANFQTTYCAFTSKMLGIFYLQFHKFFFWSYTQETAKFWTETVQPYFCKQFNSLIEVTLKPWNWVKFFRLGYTRNGALAYHTNLRSECSYSKFCKKRSLVPLFFSETSFQVQKKATKKLKRDPLRLREPTFFMKSNSSCTVRKRIHK